MSLKNGKRKSFRGDELGQVGPIRDRDKLQVGSLTLTGMDTMIGRWLVGLGKSHLVRMH